MSLAGCDGHRGGKGINLSFKHTRTPFCIRRKTYGNLLLLATRSQVLRVELGGDATTTTAADGIRVLIVIVIVDHLVGHCTNIFIGTLAAD
jgi:hypothetical protein